MMMKKRILRIALTIFLVAIMSTMSLAVIRIYGDYPDEPHDANAMWIEPSSLLFSTEEDGIGDTFDVTVWVNITSVPSGNNWVGSWQFFMIYDMSIMDCIDAKYTNESAGKSQFFEDINTFPGSPGYGNHNSTHDYVMFGEMWNPASPPPNPMRSIPACDSLATVTFNITAVPPEGETILSIIDISTRYPASTWIADDQAGKVVLNAYDCPYEFTAPGEEPPEPEPGETVLYVDPPEINSSTHPSISPSSLFTINVTVANVSDLVVCEFNLTYDSDVIGWMGVCIYKIQNQTPTAQFILDDEAGYIWLKQTYPAPVSTELSPVASLLFHVEAYGCIPLDLHDTILTNSTGEPIPHEEEDGSFCTLIQDVAITNVTLSDEWTYPGWEVNVTVTALNNGSENETFTVTAYYDTSQIENVTIADLPPGNETTIIFTWDTEDVAACTNYTISARASILPYELNTIDNEYIDGNLTVKILGDIDRNGFVDMLDLYKAGEAFGSHPGDPNWNPAADVNSNLIVDMMDLYLMAMNYGQHCSP